MKRSHPWIVARLFIGALVALGAAPLAAQTAIDRTIPAASVGELEIDLIAGSVTVSAWTRDEVRLSGTLGRGVEEVEVDVEPGRISIEVEMRSRRGRGGGDGEAHLELRVPRGLDLEIETVSAAVAVAGLDGGTVDIATVSGSVRVEGRPRTLDVESVSGGVDLVDGAERASIETVSGSSVLRGGYGDLEVSTVNGGVDLLTRSLRRGDFEAVSATLRLDVSLDGRADLRAESHSGTLELIVPSDLSARIVAETFSGRIRSELPGGRPERTSRYTSEQVLRQTAGDGAASVRLETFSGDLLLRVR